MHSTIRQGRSVGEVTRNDGEVAVDWFSSFAQAGGRYANLATQAALAGRDYQIQQSPSPA
jgi:hypothetical protein